MPWDSKGSARLLCFRCDSCVSAIRRGQRLYVLFFVLFLGLNASYTRPLVAKEERAPLSITWQLVENLDAGAYLADLTLKNETDQPFNAALATVFQFVRKVIACGLAD